MGWDWTRGWSVIRLRSGGVLRLGWLVGCHVFDLPHVGCLLFFSWVAATLLAIVFFRGVGVLGKEKMTLGHGGSL